jgi:hypothetical protein
MRQTGFARGRKKTPVAMEQAKPQICLKIAQRNTNGWLRQA